MQEWISAQRVVSLGRKMRSRQPELLQPRNIIHIKYEGISQLFLGCKDYSYEGHHIITYVMA
jgi:hypothetical protein